MYPLNGIALGVLQVLTKFCCFGDSMRKAADFKYVEQASDRCWKRRVTQALVGGG